MTKTLTTQDLRAIFSYELTPNENAVREMAANSWLTGMRSRWLRFYQVDQAMTHQQLIKHYQPGRRSTPPRQRQQCRMKLPPH